MRTLTPLLLAAALFLLVGLVDRSDGLDALSSSSLSRACEPDQPWCLALVAPLKSLADIGDAKKRSRPSKQQLPVVKIYMSDGALQKLYTKRKETLELHRAILLAEDSDWVNARISADDGASVSKGRASIRLKGDWADHLEDGRKLSFRVKLRGGAKMFGMRKFSLQDPKVRNHQNEALVFQTLRELDVLTQRYFLVDLRVNDYKIGVMALEEHFSKELVESQRRREGPILGIDEDPMWRQRFLNMNVADRKKFYARGLKPDITHYRVRDYPVKEFSAGTRKLGTTATHNSMRGQGRVRGFLDGGVYAAEAFDPQLVSRWFLVLAAFRADHGVHFHNLRFYFNPVTGLLEPVAFDNVAEPDDEEPIGNGWMLRLAGDPAFRLALEQNVKRLREMLDAPEFIARLMQTQNEWLELLALDAIIPPLVRVESLRRNLDEVEQSLREALQAGKGKRRMSRSDGITSEAFLDLDTPLYTHLRTFLRFSPRRSRLELKNLTRREVWIERVYRSDREGEHVYAQELALPAFDEERRKLHRLSIEDPEHGPPSLEPHFVDYVYKGKRHTQRFELQFELPREENGIDLEEIASLVQVNEDERSVSVPAGRLTLDRNVTLPAGWSLILRPGAIVDLREGALLKVQGPLHSLGSAEQPVTIRVESKPGVFGVGSWGGLLVMRANDRSTLRHTLVEGTGRVEIGERQDIHGLTGCVSFYESDVAITRSTFRDLQCEDALNIIRSEFSLEEILVERSQADGVDIDFSDGSLSGGVFESPGNDGLDVSGSNVRVEGTRFHRVNDKAISVGEDSRLTALRVEVDGATIGVASKDLSRAEIRDSRFRDVRGAALIAFIKKPEYGPASIDCTDSLFERVPNRASNQYGSTISIDGEQIPGETFTADDLETAWAQP